MPDFEGCYINKFFLHGIRWIDPNPQDRINQLHAGESLLLIPDVANLSDPNAVAVWTNDPTEPTRIGFVPRYLARDIRRVLASCDPDFIELTVERVNRDAPLQQRLLCRVRSCWPDDFQPCSDDDFLPIPADVPETCPA